MLPMVEPMLRANCDTLVRLSEKAAADFGVLGDELKESQ
jgi:hypothetical protein